MSRELRVNEMIRVPQVRVVDEEGNQMGVLATPEALRLAQERGYDLVEVAPMASPPVTRLLDYGQFKYEQARREKEARRHQRSVDFKEIRIKVKIGKGDFDTKVRRAIQFLEEGDRVKVTVQFRGREVSHAYLGRDLLIRFAEQVGEHAQLERQPLLEGKQMSIVMASTHKPKVQEATPDRHREAANGVEAPAAAPATTETPAAAEAPVETPVAADEKAEAPAAAEETAEQTAEPADAGEAETEPKKTPTRARTKAATSEAAKPAAGA
ncbi:MAG TPA: translation initiation factor IF-3 [Gemmataceae bacterium]